MAACTQHGRKLISWPRSSRVCSVRTWKVLIAHIAGQVREGDLLVLGSLTGILGRECVLEWVNASMHLHILSVPKSQRFLRFLRLRCPSRTPEIAAMSETREMGEGRPSHLRVVSPGQRLSTRVSVCALCGCISGTCMYVN